MIKIGDLNFDLKEIYIRVSNGINLIPGTNRNLTEENIDFIIAEANRLYPLTISLYDRPGEFNTTSLVPLIYLIRYILSIQRYIEPYGSKVDFYNAMISLVESRIRFDVTLTDGKTINMLELFESEEALMDTNADIVVGDILPPGNTTLELKETRYAALRNNLNAALRLHNAFLMRDDISRLPAIMNRLQEIVSRLQQESPDFYIFIQIQSSEDNMILGKLKSTLVDGNMPLLALEIMARGFNANNLVVNIPYQPLQYEYNGIYYDDTTILKNIPNLEFKSAIKIIIP
tara:strand:+ start:7310 stop:8173 length:864 start_codon:yes stop_codon:yes gene_type:complete